MPRVTFDELLEVYRHTAFDVEGEEGLLSIASPEVLAVVKAIEGDERLAEDANLAVLVDPGTLALDQRVRIKVSAPRLALGLLVRNFDDLLHAPEARLSEPKAYYVINGGFDKNVNPAPATLVAYRRILEVIAIFAEAASYLDRTRQELVFFRDSKFVIPIRYDTETINKFSVSTADELIEILRDSVHRDQKLAILAEAIAHICEPQSISHRFSYLLENMDALVEEIRNGYRLFASSFSYSKIRSELENAKVDYIAKIHKTLIDIQNQLLGIPVATIIVATQLKVAKSCGVEFWTNVAVLSGAWIFVALLFVAIVNQWFTLSSISSEIERQQRKLVSDYAAISDQFLDIFAGLSDRIKWHRCALIGIGVIALAGALFATTAYHQLSDVKFDACLVNPKTSNPAGELPSGRIAGQEMRAAQPHSKVNDAMAVIEPSLQKLPSLIGTAVPVVPSETTY